MITRRKLLATSAFAVSAAAGTAWPDFGGQWAAPSPPAGAARVHEITMAAPDIICIEFRDEPFVPGAIMPLDPPAKDQKQGDWIRRNGVWGRVIGPTKSHYRTSDGKPRAWADRGIMDNPDSYGAIGGCKVTAVFRKSVPYDSGTYRSERGETLKGASFKHYAYLKLDKRLPPGVHPVPIRAAGESAGTSFVFNDLTTRAISIRTNQHGHRPGDQEKIGYLALWIPGGSDDGAFSFEPYGFERFNVIDARGSVLFSGPVVLRLGPHALESSEPALHVYQQENGQTHTANRSGTYVYGLDYSGWSGGSEGFYRLQIPGLGVSDPFLVSEAAWYAAAKVSLAGIYHHRSGIALDGRFGYTRPVNQRPGMTGPVYNSKLPYLFSSENSLGVVPFGSGAGLPWRTDTVNAEAWGGYMDAGDWDRRADHLQVTNGLLLVYEILPPSSRNVSWGIPKCSELLDSSLYSSMDDLADLLHEAAFGLDLYRRMQDKRTGAVRGGIESSNTPEWGEPSFLESHTTFAYAPDHQASWRYAAAAARFARTMADLQKDDLARIYRASSQAAFAWAEQANANLDVAYAEAIALATRAGAFSSKPWSACKDAIVAETKHTRASAAAALYRLTGETEYRDLFESLFDSLHEREEGGDARWDYAKATRGNARLDQMAILDHFVAIADRYIVGVQNEATNYKSTKWAGIPMHWGQGNAPDYNQIQILLRAHARSGDPRFLRCMQAALAHLLGANQVGICMTTGLGQRTVRHPLHEDHLAMGVPAPAGITVYGYGSWQQTDYDWVWGDHHWAALPNSSGIAGQPDYEDSQKRKVHPHRRSMPLFEYFIEHPLVIMQQEYTVPQTINTLAMAALYLHAHDGNTRVNPPNVDAKTGPHGR